MDFIQVFDLDRFFGDDKDIGRENSRLFPGSTGIRVAKSIPAAAVDPAGRCPDLPPDRGGDRGGDRLPGPVTRLPATLPQIEARLRVRGPRGL
jgi:hypothetical protein